MVVSGLFTLADPIADVRQYYDFGWIPTPLCWPDKSLRCGCGKDHGPRDVGKAPILGYGYNTTFMDLKVAENFWAQSPHANVGILLQPSSLVVVDLDGREAIAEARQYGLPDTAVVETGNGLHMYYRRPDDYPIGRVTKRGECHSIDILSKGYVVAPPSRHRTGAVYTWVVPPERFDELPYPPWWTRKFFPKKRPKWLQRIGANPNPTSHFQPNHSTPAVVRTAVSYLDADDYDLWLQVGFALQMWDDDGNGNGKGFEVWDEWSSRNAKYPGTKELRQKWRSFRRNNGGVSLGTLFARAKEHGWSRDEGATMKPSPKKGTWFKRS